jgi:tetratricopeptide (TPR) repeat protein
MKFIYRLIIISVFYFPEVALAQGISARVDSLTSKAFELRNSDSKLSEQMAKEAIELSGDYPKGVHDAKLVLSIHLGRRAAFDSAISYLHECRNFFRDKDLVSYGLSNYFLASINGELQDFERALTYIQEAKRVFMKSESYNYLAWVEQQTGAIHGRQKEYMKALEHFLEAYEIKLEKGLPYNTELTSISMVYSELGEYDKALEFARKALDMSDGDYSRIKNYILIGNTYLFKDLDSAIHYYEVAEQLAQDESFIYDLASARLNKSNVLERLGKLEEAISLIRSVIDLSAATSFKESDILPHSYYMLAYYYQKLERMDSVIYFGTRSYEEANSTNNLELAKEVATILVESYDKLQRKDSAYRYLDAIVVLSDSINQRANKKQFADLRVRIETLEKQREIDLLEKQSEIDRINRLLLTAGLIAIIIIAVLILLILVYRHRARQRKSLLEKVKLQKALDAQRQELQNQTLNMINLNQGLTEMEDKIKSIKKQEEVSHRDLQTLLNGLTVNKSMDKEWSKFNDYFGKLHRNFYAKLKELHPTLTQYDLRLCALVKVDLTNQEIAGILGITTQSVRMSKYRLKSKLNLEEEQSLSDHIQSIEVDSTEPEIVS